MHSTNCLRLVSAAVAGMGAPLSIENATYTRYLTHLQHICIDTTISASQIVIIIVPQLVTLVVLLVIISCASNNNSVMIVACL